MVYFDTSFIVPLILEEITSSAVEKFVAGLPVEALAVSHWTRLEVSFLLAREVRMGGLDPKAAKAADTQFETIIRESFGTWLPSTEDFNVAKRYIGNDGAGLRAGDALHLAIANGNQAEMIYSFDKTLWLPDVKALRARLGMTQEPFASTYCLPAGTVPDWEQERTRPDALAVALLAVIDREPEIVRCALH